MAATMTLGDVEDDQQDMNSGEYGGERRRFPDVPYTLDAAAYLLSWAHIMFGRERRLTYRLAAHYARMRAGTSAAPVVTKDDAMRAVGRLGY